MRVAYCTNVSPAPSPETLVTDLGGLWSDVRAASGLERLGLGLWFPRPVAAALAGDAGRLEAVRAALATSSLDPLTYNAFPADAFHAPVVKAGVYVPDWRDPARAAYTRDVAAIAAALAPPGSEVPISTLPLGYPRWERPARRDAARALVAMARSLARLADDTGVTVRLALEPEPCCALERAADLVAFWESDILPEARGAERVVREHLGACLDLCHAAVAHEDPIASLGRYAAAGVRVPKVQVSAALHVPDPASARDRERLGPFVEARWLHQVGAANGVIVPDLPDALAHPTHASEGPWRVHFHVPLHRGEVGGLPTTRDDVARFLAHVRALPDAPLLELETYTWSIVPGAAPDLAANVAAEIRWVLERLG